MSVGVPNVASMTTDQIATTTHPTVRLVEGLRALLDAHAGVAVWTMTPSDLAKQLPALAVLLNELAAVQLQMLGEADRHQVGDPLGYANTAGWWAATTCTTKRDAHRQVALAEHLDDSSHEAVARAMTAGAVSVDQATVILNAVEALPPELVDPALRRDAEAHLVGLAEHHDPQELRLLGRRILDVLAPDVSEEAERRVLEAEEHHALATASLTMNPDGHGSMVGRFKIPVLAGEILARHLNAIAAPRHRAALDGLGVSTGSTSEYPGARVSRPLRLGQAFVEYLETRGKTGLPKAGGMAATVVVTMTMETLLGGDAAATLDTGDRVSATEARRLICGSNARSAFLGTKSEILDLGRKARFHTEAQRTVIAHRDRRCRAQDCDWPPSMCHVHHPLAWSEGGNTTVDNGMLLCPRHHTLAHDSRYQLKAGKDGKVLFSRRT